MQNENIISINEMLSLVCDNIEKLTKITMKRKVILQVCEKTILLQKYYVEKHRKILTYE